MLKISGNKSYVDIEFNGKVARFSGDMCLHGFSAIASTMEWIYPETKNKVSDDERTEIIKEVKKFCRKNRNKIVFVDDKGKKI